MDILIISKRLLILKEVKTELGIQLIIYNLDEVPVGLNNKKRRMMNKLGRYYNKNEMYAIYAKHRYIYTRYDCFIATYVPIIDVEERGSKIYTLRELVFVRINNPTSLHIHIIYLHSAM